MMEQLTLMMRLLHPHQGVRSLLFIPTVLLLTLASAAPGQQFRTNGNTNLSTNLNSVFVGGSNNVISSNAIASFIGGGRSNTIEKLGNYSFIGGGFGNFDAGGFPGTFGKYSVIVGGHLNVIEEGATWSVIGGGYGNAIRTNAIRAFIGAGALNSIGVGGTNSVIVGGFNNTVSGRSALIFGGFSNSASGTGATVLGGYFNQAAGDYSFVAGNQGRALHNGSFIWSDGGSVFQSTAPNQFLIRATGGVGINTNNPGSNALVVRGNVLVDGQITGTFNSTNATFSNLTLGGPIVATNSSIVLQLGGTTGLSITPLATNLGLAGRNLVAGHQSNSVDPGVIGATIAGGGG
jgi:hypothetical protein